MSTESSGQLHPSPEGAPPYSDMMKHALSMCESGQLQYVSATCCRLRIPFPAPGDPEWWNLDLDCYFLPETRLVPQCKLSEQTDLGIATVLAVDTYLCGAPGSKATHVTVTGMVSAITKCWEWGRLNGIYRAEDWNASHFRLLEKQLAQGRWPVALHAESRIQDCLNTRPPPKLIVRMFLGEFTVRRALKRLLGTNMSLKELNCGRSIICGYVGGTPPVGGWGEKYAPIQPSAKWLASSFWMLNLLSGLPKSYGFKLTPFPNPRERAQKMGKPNARTPTLSVDQAIAMMVHSVKVVDQHSEVICDLVREVGRIIYEAGQAEVNQTKYRSLVALNWRQSLVRIRAVEILGHDISIVSRCDRELMSVPKVVESLISACFVQIAILNARRKDEIIHKSFGLRRDSMSVINEELGVFEGQFYIEKTLKSYAPYFVNQATYSAFSVLKKLEEAQLAVEALFTGEARDPESMSHSMFWMRNVAMSNKLMSRVWFSFSFGTRGAGLDFTTAALGEGASTIRGGVHVFRRFYGIIYLYRFEHGGLLSLRYQLAHRSCEMTKQYVTSAMIDAVESRIPIAMRRPSDAVRAAVDEDWQALDEVIQEVASEKLLSVIKGLLDGHAFSGGFPRLVERLHRRLLGELDYSAMDTARQARRLQQRLMGRGHALRPLPHADCAAGTSKARGAKCSNNKVSGPAPENATAKVCSTCPYSWTSGGHIEGLKLDLKVLDDDIAVVPQGTLLHDSLSTSRVNLQEAIWLHEERINRGRQ